MRRQKVVRQNSWQQVKHAQLHSDLLQSLKPLIVLSSHISSLQNCKRKLGAAHPVVSLKYCQFLT